MEIYLIIALVFFVILFGFEFGYWKSRFNELFDRWSDLTAKYDYLLNAVKYHHDQKADDRCFFDDAKLYQAAGLEPADNRVGCKEAMLENCKRFIENRCSNGGPWKSYAELEKDNEKLKNSLNQVRLVLPEKD